MLTKTKIALAAVLLAGTATVAAAQGRAPTHETFRSAPVRMQNERAVSPNTSPVVNENDWYQTDAGDHASSPYAGGGF
ncbi:MAG: hypothetical protein V7604_4723 [Hyphomicrobiales bacterium]|jgi:hypothetical protein